MFPWGCNRPVYWNAGHRVDGHWCYALTLESCEFEASAFILVRLLGPFLIWPLSQIPALSLPLHPKFKEKRMKMAQDCLLQTRAWGSRSSGLLGGAVSWPDQGTGFGVTVSSDCSPYTDSLSLGGLPNHFSMPHFTKYKRRLFIIIHWVGQKVCLGFSVTSYEKPEWTLANSIFLTVTVSQFVLIA